MTSPGVDDSLNYNKDDIIYMTTNEPSIRGTFLYVYIYKKIGTYM